MKVYKVISMVMNYGRSFTPRLGDPVTPPDSTFFAGLPGYREAWDLLGLLGYTEPQRIRMIQALYVHAYHSCGLTSPQAWLRVRDMVVDYAARPRPPLIPPQVIYVLGIAAIVVIGVALVLPAEFEELVTPAPGAMYCFVNESAVWYGELAAVSPAGRGMYEICGEVAGPLNSIRKNVRGPFGMADQLWFLGTVMWEGWRVPYFRRYQHVFWRAEYLDVALHSHGPYYYLKHDPDDPYLPRAPYIRPGTQFGTPGYTGIYVDWPWSVVL